jgi:hypothetical protein
MAVDVEIAWGSETVSGSAYFSGLEDWHEGRGLARATASTREDLCRPVNHASTLPNRTLRSSRGELRHLTPTRQIWYSRARVKHHNDHNACRS